MVAEGHHVLDAFTQAKFGKRAILPEISWHETCSKYSSSRHHLYIYIKKKSAETTHSIYSRSNIDELSKEVVPLKKDQDEPCLAFRFSAEPALGLSGLLLSSCSGDGEGTFTLTLKTWIVPLSLETASHLDS